MPQRRFDFFKRLRNRHNVSSPNKKISLRFSTGMKHCARLKIHKPTVGSVNPKRL